MAMQLKTIVAYVCVNLALEHVNSVFMLFCIWYMTNKALVQANFVGGVIIIYRIWDALNDPIVGYLSDQTSTRWGRRVPWLAGGMLPYVFFFVLFWKPQTGTPSQLYLFFFFLLVQMGIDGGYTSIFVPYITLLNDLTTDYSERFRVNILRFVGSIMGSGSAFVLAFVVFTFVTDPVSQFFVLGCCIATVYLPTMGWCVYELSRASAEVQKSGVVTAKPSQFQTWGQLFSTIVQLFKVKEFVIVLCQNACCTVAAQSSVHVLPYLVMDYMKMSQIQLVVCVLVSEGFGVAAAGIVLTAAKDVPKKTLFFYGTTAWLFFYACVPFITSEFRWVIYPFSIILGIGVATSQMIPMSYATDLGDYVDLAIGRRIEGLIFSLIHVAYKVGVGLSLLVFEQLLHSTGFTPHNKEGMPLSVERGIRWYTFFVPGGLILCAIFLNKHNPICKADHARVMKALEERNNSRSGSADSTPRASDIEVAQ
eukprot:TRINITY_DN1673_c0_g1_i4.p1 TRINITY_DN1673_c0_g1~~TRINITY_DN1673_c0_g1_i4.p1  ORF type:complete len:503 (-),score=132.25 TRINITY_DN1673_c0_g1_i4:1382-2815(-)